MDPVALGALVTGVVGLVGVCISRTRCFMRVLPGGEGEDRAYQWQCGAGFTEATLVPSESHIESHVLSDNEILFLRKPK